MGDVKYANPKLVWNNYRNESFGTTKWPKVALKNIIDWR